MISLNELTFGLNVKIFNARAKAALIQREGLKEAREKEGEKKYLHILSEVENKWVILLETSGGSAGLDSPSTVCDP